MTIKQQGGIFGRNPTFNDLDVDGSANLGSSVDINGGNIDGTTIGSSSAAASTFSSSKVTGSSTGSAVDVSSAFVVQNTAGSAFGQGAPVKFFHGAGDTDNNYTAALIGEYSTWSPTNGLGGGVAIYTKNSGSESKPSKKAEFTFTGNLSFNSGLGIDFSATSDGSGTSTSELFDDYEEGTWTPAYSTDGTNFSSITYDTQSGTYTKVGRLVTVSGFIRTDAITVGSASGNVLISGLPYTSTSASVGSISGTYNWGGDYPLSCVVYGSSTSMYLYYRASVNGSDSTIVPSDMGTGANNNDIYFTITYMAS